MQGSLEILRQSGWDIWSFLCIAAGVALIAYAILGRLWTIPTASLGWVIRTLVSLGIAASAIVVAAPSLHQPLIGMFWTLLLLSILSATFYLNLTEQFGPRRMLTLLAIRLLALALLVPMLFEPVWRIIATQPPDQPIIFLIDNSGSMSVPDVSNGPTRIQSIWQTLAPLLPKIRAHFLPRFYTFATTPAELKQPEDLAHISADGKSTDFAAAVAKAAADSAAPSGPSAAAAPIILISDGNDNVSPNVADLIRQSQRTVHTISLGSSSAAPADLINVAVDSVTAPPEIPVGQAAKLSALITNTALAKRVIDVKLSETSDDGKPTGDITTQRLVLQPSPTGQTVDLPYTAHTPGVHKLSVWIDPIPGERTLADNRQDIQILAVESRLKVLYIEGALRSEYTYLYRMLGHDADIELATLLRTQGDRFKAEGSIDSTPFLAMPKTPADWSKFDVIMIGDLDSTFLPAGQQSLIRQRVSEGGGLIMIGGEKNFGAGGYQNSPLEEALPVFVGPAEGSQDLDEFVPQLTAEGAANPIFDQLTDWFPAPGKPAAKTLSPLKGNVVVAAPKSGAQILMVHPAAPGTTGAPATAGKDQIVLAVEQYGRGRSAAFTADTTNIWFRQFRAQGQESAYNRFWGQLIGWLGGQDSRKRQQGASVEALLDKSVYRFGEPVHLRALVRDDHGDTTQFANVAASLASPTLPKPLESPLTATPSRSGEYQLALPPPGEPGLKPGDYTLDISAAKDNAPLGHQSLKFSVIPPEDEMLKIAANPQLMDAIATATGGYHRVLAELPELLDNLIASAPAANQPTIQRTIPLANTVRLALSLTGHTAPWPPHSDLPMQGALVVSLLVIEWILRRKWQLP